MTDGEQPMADENAADPEMMKEGDGAALQNGHLDGEQAAAEGQE